MRKIALILLICGLYQLRRALRFGRTKKASIGRLLPLYVIMWAEWVTWIIVGKELARMVARTEVSKLKGDIVETCIT